MKKRLFSLLLCVIAMFSVYGCNFAGDTQKNTTSPIGYSSNTETSKEEEPTQAVDYTKYDVVDLSWIDYRTSLYSSVELTMGYESLKTEEQKMCYRYIDDHIIYVSKEKDNGSYPILPIVMNGVSLSEAQLHLVLSAYSMDHPQVFWLDSKFSYYSTDQVTYLQLNSGMKVSKIKEDAKQMGDIIEDIFTYMPGDMSGYEKELYLHDEFLKICEYADTDNRSTDDFRIYTSAGGLVDNYAVCEGYSRSMQLLLSLSGVESYYVFGEGNDNLHMWNVVNVDDIWYHLDSTWNDTAYSVEHEYFNLTTEEILRDHTLSPYFWELTEEEICGEDRELAQSFNLFIPECNGTEGSFYSKNSIKVTGFDEGNLRKIANGFTEALDNDEKVIYLYLDPEYLVFSSAVDNLLYSGDYAIFDAIDIANSQLSDTRIKSDYVETTEIPENNILCVYFECE